MVWGLGSLRVGSGIDSAKLDWFFNWAYRVCSLASETSGITSNWIFESMSPLGLFILDREFLDVLWPLGGFSCSASL